MKHSCQHSLGLQDTSA